MPKRHYKAVNLSPALHESIKSTAAEIESERGASTSIPDVIQEAHLLLLRTRELARTRDNLS